MNDLMDADNCFDVDGCGDGVEGGRCICFEVDRKVAICSGDRRSVMWPMIRLILIGKRPEPK